MEANIIKIGDNKVSVKQTSNGRWYTNELSISCYSIIDGIALMDRAIYETNMLLEKYNTPVEEDKKKSSTSTRTRKPKSPVDQDGILDG